MFNVQDLTEKATKQYLQKLIEKLDDLDCEDFFGSEGWKHYLGFED